MKMSKGEKWFSDINHFALACFGLLALAPFIHILAQSFSSYRAIVSGEVSFLPVEWTTEAYVKVFNDPGFVQSFLVSVQRTVVGTIISVVMTMLLAYPLSRYYIKGRGPIMFLIVFTMLFSGGMIPTYLVIKELHLMNTFWAYVIPGAVNAFHVVIMKNFFQSIPNELEESARIDGSSNLGILFRIVVPLSMPVIATIALFNAVGQWNSFFDAVMYVTDSSLKPLQIYLRELVMSGQSNINTTDSLERQLLAVESLKAAALIASTLPILLVYPFLQKYFVKGIMIGSVKG
ncbi:carbohydrate ABC transporter permease [Paenibacillus lautus]|uniref:carbohydrate ABC transporter permease n=1 Tax=Paenibacillus lautus TaxID=1401 RepID=UPI002DBA61F8|nr:carbohydrate ABC transporter permease [Paenibacillus lautus]MEC0307039.1 carbohydrate ABC transporter permease [Paenibacillus lautus]